MNHTKQSVTDVFRASSKRAIQKLAKENVDLVDKKCR